MSPSRSPAVLLVLVLLFAAQYVVSIAVSPAQSSRSPVDYIDHTGPQIPIQEDGGPGSKNTFPSNPLPAGKYGNFETADSSKLPASLQAVLDAIEVMQAQYFDVFTGTWPDAIDWTAAVCGTQVSATLSSIVSSFETTSSTTCSDLLAWQNLVDRYFAQTSVFYFGENAFSLRNQAYDDMLWVVLGWLENIKFVEMYSRKNWEVAKSRKMPTYGWHGLQFSAMAAHRARIFYELASNGWDTLLCGGGMTWNPRLRPYKNAITNELFIAASISMYLYFPGDNNTSPYFSTQDFKEASRLDKPHDPALLGNAVKAYKWLHESQLQDGQSGLYADGYHITGWRRFPNGTEYPGTGNCDDLNSMVYTYNQGVLLSAHRGLWLSTGLKSYLDDGHKLVDAVVRATGWPNTNHDRDHPSNSTWYGLGRAGVLEEFCDHGVYCSQDAQTFKGIFFTHFAEFCRPLWPHEQAFMDARTTRGFDRPVYENHQARCAAYGKWVRHNARAASLTRDEQGRFGMWWGREYPDAAPADGLRMDLPAGTVDYVNDGVPHQWALHGDEQELVRDRQAGPLRQTRAEDVNNRGRGRTVETQSGGLAVLRAHWQWESMLHSA